VGPGCLGYVAISWGELGKPGTRGQRKERPHQHASVPLPEGPHQVRDAFFLVRMYDSVISSILRVVQWLEEPLLLDLI
jgi:hypothetical protein